MTYRYANDEDLNMICAEIENGIFTTDRVSLDNKFGVKLANRRYSLWVQDEWKRGAVICIALFKNQPAGFTLYKFDSDKNLLNDIIGGCFKKITSEKIAPGSAFFYAGRKCFLDNEWKKHRSSVSSNNLGALNLHLMFGAKIFGIENILVKHFD